MENAENSLKIDVIIPVNRPFIEELMTLWWISDEPAKRSGNNAKLIFFSDDHDLKDKIVNDRRREIWYRTTESIKRQLVKSYVADISDVYE